MNNCAGGNARSWTGIAERPRIAILENDDGVRRSLQLLLQGRGFDVRAYGRAEALLADGGIADFACLVADYRLTGTDGIAVLKGLRARDWHGPAVLVTGFGSDELAAEAKMAGFCAVFEKPLKDHALLTSLEELTDRHPPK